MIRWKRLRMLAMLVWLPLCGIASAQSDDSSPLVFVTTVTGGGATRGVSGPSFLVDKDSEEENGVGVGESVVTHANGTAILTLPAHGTMVRLGPSSQMRVGTWASGENGVPVTLTLVSGRAYILRRRADDWLVVAAESEADSGYALSKSRALLVTSEDAGVSLAVVDGAATWFSGAIPGETLLDEAGDPKEIDRGTVVQAGQRISAEMQTEEIAASLSMNASNEATRDVYAFGLTHGARWVADAETGDLTPVRAAARSTAQFARAEISTELAFDQPRSVLSASTPRAVTQPLRTTPRSPVRSLLESGLPTNVVVGQRIRRTRIIGSSGTGSGSIRVNPNVQPLLRLTGSSR